MVHTSGCVLFVVDVSRGAETPCSLSHQSPRAGTFCYSYLKWPTALTGKNMAGVEVLGVSVIDVGEKEFTVSKFCCSVFPFFITFILKRGG